VTIDLGDVLRLVLCVYDARQFLAANDTVTTDATPTIGLLPDRASVGYLVVTVNLGQALRTLVDLGATPILGPQLLGMASVLPRDRGPLSDSRGNPSSPPLGARTAAWISVVCQGDHGRDEAK
jgi:hypothetical protein